MSFSCISVDAARKMLDEKNVTVVDIRDPSAFAAAHVEGAWSLNNSNVQQFIEQADMDAPVLVFCYHGHSSQGAADFLAKQGFAEVYSVDGGFEAWRARFL